MGLDTDSSRTTWIVAEGGNPGKICSKDLTSHPPQWDTLGTFWIAGDPRPHTSLHWGAWTHSSSTPTTYPPISPPPPPPPTQGFLTGGCILRGGEGGGATGKAAPGHRSRDPRSFGLFSPRLCSSAARLGSTWGQHGSAPPFPSAPTGKFATLSLLHLCFACGMAVDGELPPIWEAFAQGKWRFEGLATLNQALMRGLLSYCRVFGGRDHFSASPPYSCLSKT